MRKITIITSLTLSALLILDSMNIGHALMMLVIAGLIPGTGIYLDADTTVWLFMGVIGFIASRLSTLLVTAARRAPKLSRQRA